MGSMLARLRRPVTPELYARATRIHLCALTLIVLTGAAVRLTGSGLGCENWPKCGAHQYFPPLDSHALIEFGNRVISGLVTLTVIVTITRAIRRRPFRRDLLLLAIACFAGVLGQAVLGGITVKQDLRPGYVMGHFGLSMLILIAAVTLDFRARHEPGTRPALLDRASVWAVRGLLPLGALTLFVGTAATAAGPHSGGKPGQDIHRLDFKGSDTLNWLIHRHGGIATILGVATAGTWLLLRTRRADTSLQNSVAVVLGLLAAQGVVGITQYELKLPGEIVWVHVGLAGRTWIGLLWSVGLAGRARPAPLPAPPPVGERELREKVATG
jgi:cytochrome c oxidase assembly protein subunit 15